ncbi:MAG: hypothetical protein WBF13_10640 [Candidatus Zixiibacteriota bacterium]
MKRYRKRVGVISVFLALVVLVASFGLSQAQKGMMQEKGMMGEMKDDMNKTMGRCEGMMKNMDMMMGKKMSHGCMGMMNMKGMGMMMHNMSQNMMGMMENMESMMDNPEMMKDAEVKKHMDGMHEQMMMMSENMQKAMGSMEMMQKRMEQMETK